MYICCVCTDSMEANNEMDTDADVRLPSVVRRRQ
jgi:hypothetical protein